MIKCWIKTDFVPEDSKDYITEGKWYEVELEENLKGGGVLWDSGIKGYAALTNSSHLNCKDWQVHYGGTPPEDVTTHRTLATNNKLDNLEWGYNVPRDYVSAVCTVDDWGCIKPVFDLRALGAAEFYNLTSGKLKYFDKLRGKTVKLTLEVIEEE